MKTEKKSTWGGKRANAGGKREGAGRKPIDRSADDVPKHRGFYCTNVQWEKIKSLANAEGKSYSQFILDRLGI